MNSIVIDAMGGDSAPSPEVAGAVAAVRELPLRAVLVGNEPAIRRELAELEFESDRLEVVHAAEVVTMHDNPTQAFRHKTESSLRIAMNYVERGEAAAFVSAGNSGAVLAHALFQLKRLPEVLRPGIVAVWPTPAGSNVVLCDVGANVDIKPAMLAQFGVLGAHFDRLLHHGNKPRVGILSNGTEPSKGTELTRRADALLRAAAEHDEAGFDYVGYVEGTDVLRGGVDVVATDGFTGNVMLKIGEGVAEAVLKMVKARLESSTRAKLGAALAKPALLELANQINPSEFGGAPLLGVRGVVMICHGSSDGIAIRNAIKQADGYVKDNLIESLGAAIARHHSLWTENADDDSADATVAAASEGGA